MSCVNHVVQGRLSRGLHNVVHASSASAYALLILWLTLLLCNFHHRTEAA